MKIEDEHGLMKKSFILIVCLCAACASVSHKFFDDDIYSKRFITSIMRKVCDWQIANPVELNSKNSNKWARSAFYTGVMAAYSTTQDETYLDQAVTWAEAEGWKAGERPRHADDHTCGQTYLEIYFLKKDPAMIADIKSTFDSVINNPKPGREDWWWCDALFMAPPVLSRLAAATGDDRYLAVMNAMWWDTTDFLYDEDEGFYYRDKRFIGKLNANGQKIFWSRGNGWVMGGIIRVLEYLPEDNPYFNRYIGLLRTMAVSVAGVQGEDGLWRTSLFDPDEAPAPETSGSGFFCYALAWGVNNGYLDRETYEPVVKQAWAGLVSAVHSSGKLGWVQEIGHKPEDVSRDDNQEYGSGAFLLAGSEMVKLK